MSKTYSIKIDKKWGYWGIGFLALAQQGFLSLKCQKNLGKIEKIDKNMRKHFSNADFKKYQMKLFPFKEGHMLIASIWNIKHGVELLVKALRVNLDKKFKDIHNLENLMSDTQEKLNGLCIDAHLDIFKSLVNKYHQCDFSKKTFCKEGDNQNVLFKYPEGKNGNGLDYSFVHDIKRKDINQFLKDIHNLERLYFIIKGQPQWFKLGEKFGTKKKDTEKELKRVPIIKNLGLK